MLLPPVIACIEDTFYKITSEALLVIQHLVKVMRPQGQAGGFDPKPFVKEVKWLRTVLLSGLRRFNLIVLHSILSIYHFLCVVGAKN